MLNDFDSKNIILVKTFQFSLDIIKYVNVLNIEKQYVISKQLLRSATSIGANIKESQHAESAAKEASESEYWLLLCKHSNQQNCDELLNQIDEIQKIISKIIFTTKTYL